MRSALRDMTMRANSETVAAAKFFRRSTRDIKNAESYQT